MWNDQKAKARAEIDERLSVLRPIGRFAPPPKGWVRAIRDALGLTMEQYGRRLGVKRQSVMDLETSEASGAIQLKSLRAAAAALDCTLFYALVPNQGLENTVETLARRIADRELSFVEHSMALDGQGLDRTARQQRLDRYIRETLTEKRLWDQS